MKFRLPDSVASSQDLTALLIEVREYARWFAHESIKQRMDAAHVSAQPVLSQATTDFIRTQALKSKMTQQGLDGLVKMLESYSRTAPSITLTLAALPTLGIKSTLVAWCRDNVAPDVLVTFKLNTTLLGGMVVQYGSRVFDWSFRRQILSTRERFPEVLRSV